MRSNESTPSFCLYTLKQGLKSAAFPALLILIAVLGAVHILVRTSTYGLALINDAFNYISAAESLAARKDLLSPGGQMVLFAPFLSLALAFLSLFGVEPIDGAGSCTQLPSACSSCCRVSG